MLFLFRYHHIMPSAYYQMTYGEKRIVRALIHCEVEDRNAEYEQILST